MRKYILQLTGSVAVQAIELEIIASTDTEAIHTAVRRAEAYYPVYFSGALWHVDPAAIGEPRLVAMLTGKVQFTAKSEAA